MKRRWFWWKYGWLWLTSVRRRRRNIIGVGLLDCAAITLVAAVVHATDVAGGGVDVGGASAAADDG